MASTLHFTVVALVIFSFARSNVSAKPIYEDGYSVTTVLDGNKININPHSVAVLPGSNDMLVLDSVNSVLYRIAQPISKGSVAERFSGNGDSGFSDGDRGFATFNKPRSFAIDGRGNVYVADKNNFAVRKISRTGVTTIAGGNSVKPGHADGPGRSASFSTDFEMVFVSDMCSLLISDHGNKLVRQINLKPEDCVEASPSGLRTSAIWAVGLGLSCFLGSILGFLARPYISKNDRLYLRSVSKTWSHFLMNLGRQVLIHYYGIRNAVARSAVLTLPRRLVLMSLSFLSLMFGFKKTSNKVVHSSNVALLDCDADLYVKSQPYFDQMRELIPADGCLNLLSNSSSVQANEAKSKRGCGSDCHGSIDDLLQANLLNFAEDTHNVILTDDSQLANPRNLIKRR